MKTQNENEKTKTACERELSTHFEQFNNKRFLARKVAQFTIAAKINDREKLDELAEENVLDVQGKAALLLMRDDSPARQALELRSANAKIYSLTRKCEGWKRAAEAGLITCGVMTVGLIAVIAWLS